MAEKKPICTGRNAELGKYQIFETANGARLYIKSEKFGLVNMQGKQYQEKARALLAECQNVPGLAESDAPAEKPETPVKPETPPEPAPENDGFFSRLFNRG